METCSVKVGVFPGKVQEIVVECTTTILQAIVAAGINPDGYQIRVNSMEAEDPENDKVSDGDSIILTKKVKSN